MADDSVALVKRTITLSKYIAQFTTVKSSGGSNTKFMAFCPFHDNTKTMAMSITDGDGGGGLWKCFAGCGGGSIIDFWLKKHGYDEKDISHFGEAVEALASESGITLPERPRKEAGAKEEISKTRIKKALEAVADAACDNLFKTNKEEYRLASDYLVDRNVSDKILEKYLMGIIPQNREDAVKFITRASGDVPAAIAGGILVRNVEDGSLWTPFSGRLIVPIFDRSGGVIGYGGRIVPGVKSTGQGKWINPTSTPVYDKSKVMYGLDQLSGSDNAVVVEGYFDAIAITESDIDAVGVACCGTSFTTGHVETLKKVKGVAFIFDGDEAGSKALSSAYWVANKRSDSTYVSLPDGTDPWQLQFGGLDGNGVEVDPDPQILVTTMNSRNPLLEGCVKARHSVEKTDQDFDEWVATTLSNLHDSFSRDQIVTSAAKERGYSKNSYNRALSGVKIGKPNRSGDESAPSAPIVTDPNTGPMIVRILQMSEDEKTAVFAMVSKWDTYIEEVISDWFPGTDDLDLDVFQRMITGGIEMEAANSRSADKAVSMLMPADEDPTQDISRSLRSIITLMGHEGKNLAINPKTPVFLNKQLLSLRKLSSMAGELEHQPFVLSTLIDIGLDIKRFERVLERAEAE